MSRLRGRRIERKLPRQIVWLEIVLAMGESRANETERGATPRGRVLSGEMCGFERERKDTGQKNKRKPEACACAAPNRAALILWGTRATEFSNAFFKTGATLWIYAHAGNSQTIQICKKQPLKLAKSSFRQIDGENARNRCFRRLKVFCFNCFFMFCYAHTIPVKKFLPPVTVSPGTPRYS